MTKLTFYGGVRQIGGNKILLEDGDTKLFFDFGQCFGFGEEFFINYLKPRESRFGLRDFFALDLMPRIEGLYSEAALEATNFKHTPPEFQGVFLSHIHSDHSSHIRFIDEQIPVYLGVTAKRILDSWETTSTQKFGEHDYQTFKTGKKIHVDDVTVVPVHVDHSTPSAYGFIIHTSDATIVYTGDFRLHGPHAHMTSNFIEEAAKAEPDVMICEGTRVAPEDKRENLSEREVYDRCEGLISNCNKLVITCFYPRDVDRMKTYHKLAQELDKKFVVSTRVAHLLGSLSDDPGIKVPDPFNDKHMLVYCREMNRTEKWEREIRECQAGVDSEYVKENQSDLILHMDFHYFNELIDVEPHKGSLFIHSMSEPNEEDDEEAEVRQNWINHFELKHHQAHASGHMNKEELGEVIKKINPRKIIPVHTEHPEMFREYAREAIVAEEGREYRI